jgi:hypothetical protein
MQWGKLNFGGKRQGDFKPSDYGGIFYDTALCDIYLAKGIY